MKNRKYRTIIIAAVMSLWGVILGCQSAMALSFQITVENLSNNVLTPVPLITHNAGFDLFDGGTFASSAVEDLAEGGVTSGIMAQAAAGQTAGTVLDYQVALNGGPITPGNSASATVEGDISHGWLSYLSMLAFSNDAFIGGTTGDGAIALFSGGAPVYGTYYITPAMVWDAGTEINDELAANVPALGGMGSIDQGGVISLSHPGIQGIGDIGSDRDWTSLNAVASITVGEPVPEPATMLLFGTGLAGLAGIARRKKR